MTIPLSDVLYDHLHGHTAHGYLRNPSTCPVHQSIRHTRPGPIPRKHTAETAFAHLCTPKLRIPSTDNSRLRSIDNFVMSLAMMPSQGSTNSRYSNGSDHSSLYQSSRQGTTTSRDGSKSTRQSKRYSLGALYLSINAKDKELEVEDDLARGKHATPCGTGVADI